MNEAPNCPLWWWWGVVVRLFPASPPRGAGTGSREPLAGLTLCSHGGGRGQSRGHSRGPLRGHQVQTGEDALPSRYVEGPEQNPPEGCGGGELADMSARTGPCWAPWKAQGQAAFPAGLSKPAFPQPRDDHGGSRHSPGRGPLPGFLSAWTRARA